MGVSEKVFRPGWKCDTYKEQEEFGRKNFRLQCGSKKKNLKEYDKSLAKNCLSEEIMLQR